MVFFTCNSCNETLKKKDVEKHWTTKCRKCEVLSCVDCGKEFWGNSYAEHIKCISEDAKYAGKDFKAKVNKGEAKQELWIQNIRNASVDSKNPRLANLFRSVLEYDNVPRKKSKFENFLKNSVRITDKTLIHQAWDVFSSNKEKSDSVSSENTKVQSDVESSKPLDNQRTEPLDKITAESTSANNVNTEHTSETHSARKSKKKRKHKDVDDVTENEKETEKVCEVNNDVSEHADHSHSERKAKQKRKHKDIDDNDVTEKKKTVEKVCEVNNVNSERADQFHSEKKDKKKRKHKDEDEVSEKEKTAQKVGEVNSATSEHIDNLHTEEKAKKKRKHKHDDDANEKEKSTEQACEDPDKKDDAIASGESLKKLKKKRKDKDKDDIHGNNDSVKGNSEESQKSNTAATIDSVKEQNQDSVNDDANVSIHKKHKKKQKQVSSDAAATAVNGNAEKESNETGKSEISSAKSEATEPEAAVGTAVKKKKKRKHKEDGEEALLPKKEKSEKQVDVTAVENHDVKTPTKPKTKQNEDLDARLEVPPMGDGTSGKRTSKTGKGIQENNVSSPKTDEKIAKDGDTRNSCENANTPDTPDKFNWRKTIDRCLTDAATPDKGVKFKKLKKQILTEYRDQCLSSKSKTDDEILEEFDRKMKKYQDKYHIADERVKFVSIK